MRLAVGPGSFVGEQQVCPRLRAFGSFTMVTLPWITVGTENHCVLWRCRHRCHCSLSYRRGPFESKCRKQLSLSSCGWVLIRSGQFKITLVAGAGNPAIDTFVLDQDVGHHV